MIRLGDGIFSWSSFDLEKKYNFNGFLIKSSYGTLVIDPPPFSKDDRAYFDQLGCWPDYIVITNRNHLRDRQWFTDKKKTPTAMHEAEVSQVNIPVEKKLVEGDKFLGGIEVIHLPGKSPGEIALYWQERGILIVGDALIGDPPGSVRLLPEAKMDDPARLKASLRKLEDLAYDTLLFADGDPILKNAKLHTSLFIAQL